VIHTNTNTNKRTHRHDFVTEHLGHQLGSERDNNSLRNTYSKCKYGGSGTRHTESALAKTRERVCVCLCVCLLACICTYMQGSVRLSVSFSILEFESEKRQAAKQQQLLLLLLLLFAVSASMCRLLLLQERLRHEQMSNRMSTKRARNAACWLLRL